jgi:alkyl hydroperoxide reductase subunit AhpF
MPEKLLNNEIVEQLINIFNDQLVHPVEISLFLSRQECATCDETHQLLEEITSTTEKIHLEIYDVNENQNLAKQFGINSTPAIVITGRENNAYLGYAFRFFGIPTGYEFSSLIQGILMISKRNSGLQHDLQNEIHKINKPVNLKVFVTPT